MSRFFARRGLSSLFGGDRESLSRQPVARERVNAKNRRRRSRPLMLEQLEERTLLAMIMVTTVNQEVDTDADCSLQEAIYAANFNASEAINPSNLNGPHITTGCTAGSGADTIVLPANGVFQVSGIVNDQFDIAGLSANPDIRSTMTIQGNGSRLELVGSLNLRAFVVNQQVGMEVSMANGNLTIQNMHIKGFKADGGDGADGGGGGLGAGGAIYVRNGTLTVENSTFEGNTVVGGTGGANVAGTPGGGGGGGIGGNGGAHGAGASANNTFGGGAGGGGRGNGGNSGVSGGGGGGTANDGVVGGDTVGGNGGFNCGGKGGRYDGSANPPSSNGGNGFCTGGGAGGGAAGPNVPGGGDPGMGIPDAPLNPNAGVGGIGNYSGGGGGGGGGISDDANGGNGGAGGFGGGGGAGGLGDGAGTDGAGGAGGFGGGGGAGAGGAANGAGGSFAGNAGGGNGGGGAGLGGAIFNDSGNVTIRNSTFVGNTVAGGAAGGAGAGAGSAHGSVLFARNGSTKFYNSTIDGNTATGGDGAIYIFGDSAVPGPSASFIIRNSIVSNNGTNACFLNTEGMGGSVATAGSGNLIRNNGAGNNACAGVVTTADPMLGPLQLNAPGNTPTKAILSTSPAFNTGDNAACLATDQRGVTRPQGAGCDIGAYELEVADLSITKTATVDVAIAGTDLFYNIHVHNFGPGAASSAVVTDVLADGLTFLGDTAPDGCTLAMTTLTCDLGVIPNGGNVDFQIKVFVAADFVALEADGTKTLVNTATVSGLFDPNPANNSSTERIFVEDESDLVITKFTVPFGTVRTGEIFIYTIYVDNLGPSAARNVVIHDTLLNSAQVQIQSCALSVSQGGGAITQFDCNTGPIISTQFGSGIGTFGTTFLLPFGTDLSDPMNPTPQGRLRGSFRLVVNDGETDTGSGGAAGPNDNITITNLTRVVSDTPDPDTSNNVNTSDVTVIRTADLALTKLATGEEQQVNQAGLMFNNAVFGQAFPTAPNYFASTRVTAGRRIQYTLTATNNGPSDARNVVVSDLLPAGVRIYQGSLTTTKGTCDGGTPGEPLNRIVCGLGTLDAPHPMASPAAVTSATITFEVIVDASTPAGDVLVNEANVTSDTLEVDNDDNQARTENTVLAAADLSVNKSSVGENVTGYNATLDRLIENDVASAVTAGKVLRYEISVQNNGPSDSQNVTISDALPSTPLPGPVTFLSADGASCRPSAVDNDTLFCSVGTLTAGERRTFDVYVFVDPSVPAATVLQNCVTALTGPSNVVPPGAPPSLPGGPTQSLTFDPLTTNNTNVCTNTTVNAVADLAITKTATPPKLLPGDELTYHIRVENLGPSAASNVIVTDTLPAGVHFEFDTDTCSLMSSNPDVVKCSLGTIQPGEVVEFDIVAEVTAAVPSGVELCNTAVVASTAPPSPATTDFNLTNNTAIACNFTIPGADLSVTKSGPATINPGTNITYTITVSNAGPTAGINAVLEDFIPAGERTLSISPETGNCLAGVAGDADRPTTCNLGTINAGDSVEITVVVEANNCLEDLDQLFNDVVVSSDTFDEDTSNNVFHSTTEVRQSANGNITAAASRGNLTIQGDNFNNTFRIDTPDEANPHALRITPFGGTKVNGECRSVQVHGVKGNVSIRMGRANDQVFFDGPVTLRKSLKIYMGQGNDVVSLDDVEVAGITSIRVDGDHDAISVLDSLLGSLSIRSGRLGDSILIDNTHVRGTTLIRSDGSIDSVRIFDSIFDEDVLIQGGRDSDTLDIGILSVPNANGNDFNATLNTRGFENVIS